MGRRLPVAARDLLGPDVRGRRHIGRNRFEHWLGSTFPEWTWRWRYQRHIYQKFADVITGKIKRLERLRDVYTARACPVSTGVMATLPARQRWRHRPRLRRELPASAAFQSANTVAALAILGEKKGCNHRWTQKKSDKAR